MPAALLLSVLLFGAGVSLAARALAPCLSQDRLRALARRLKQAHLCAIRALFGRPPLRIPGIELVESARGTLLAAFALAAAAAAILAAGVPAGRALRAAGAACAAAVLLAWCSLRREARRALAGVRRDLPGAAFLHALLLESGVGHHAAFSQVVRSLPRGPLRAQMEEIARGRTMGVPAATLFEESKRRVPLEEFYLFVELLAQGERLGTGLAPALADLSQKMIEDRTHRAEAAAQRAAVKMLFPLVALIFPAVFLVVVSPVIMSLWDLWSR